MLNRQDVKPTPLPDPRTGEDKRQRYVTVKTAEEWFIRQARLRPDRFLHYVLGQKPARHHDIWLAKIFDFRKETRKNRIQIIAPRESAKTTITTYAMVWFISRFPFLSNAIVSVSSSQSKRRMHMIREIIENDPAYKNVFPHIHIDTRQTNNIDQFSVYADAIYYPEDDVFQPITYAAWRSMLKRMGSLKDPTLIASSLRGKAVIGARYSGIVLLDDIVDHNYLKPELQEDVYHYILETLIPTLQDNAKMINIMTRWMVDDVADLLKRNPAWESIEIKAIYSDENGKEYSYWPEYWPLEKLYGKREEMGDKFDVMYMNNPYALTSNKFNSIMLSEKSLPETMPPLKEVIIGTDFAIETGRQNDFSVFIALGVADNDDHFVLDYVRIKATPDIVERQLAFFAHRIIEQYEKLDAIVIEKVGFQGNYQYSLMMKYPHLPAVQHVPIGGKDNRMDLFARKVNEGDMYFNTENIIHRELIRECLNYPNYAHDDIADAITIAMQWRLKFATTAKMTKVISPYLL